MVDIQYKPTLVDSDQSDIRSFIKSPRISISSSGMELLHKSKSHLDLHIKLKGGLPIEKLCPYGSSIVQVTGANALLNYYFYLYTKNHALKESLSVCLL